MLIAIYNWIWRKGYDFGYNSALQDIKLSMQDRELKDLDWELDLLRIG